MTKKLSILTILLASTHFCAPALFAQSAGSSGVQASTPPAPATQSGTEAADPQADGDTDVSVPGGAEEEDIVVRGRFVPDVLRVTPEVVTLLGAADIARTGEGDIAGALTRVTGLSIVGSGFVFVRGLGDRYSSSLLNGSPLPSPDPLRRSVPLDIFPTTIVSSALVQKSYSVNFPAEFGGGVINLTTRAVPNEDFVNIGASMAIDTETTGKLGYTYYGSKTDWLGYDAGDRNVPAVIKQGALTRPSFFSNEILNFTNANTTILQKNGDIPPSLNLELSTGGALDVGDTRLGLIASIGVNNGWRTRQSIQQDTIDPAGLLRNDFRTVLTDNRIVVNGLFGLGAEFGDHKARFTNVYIHDTLKQARLATADVYTNFQPGQPLLQQNTNWFERQLFDSQVVGEFRFGDFSLDVRGAYANSRRDAPYERSFSYRFDPNRGQFVNSLNNLGESAEISFSELDEDLWTSQIDASYKLPTERPVTVSTGYFFSDTDRTSSRFDFRYRNFNGGGVGFPISALRPDLLLSNSSILNACNNPTTIAAEDGCIRLFNLSGQAGAAVYRGRLRINAGYGQVEAELLDGVRLTAGVRYEEALQRVSTNSASFTGTRLANDYWLPAVTATWNFIEDMQLRLHFSKTIARPQFRELAPQIYRDFEFDRFFFGNPQLVDSELTNYEGRYEWFFGRDERLTIAGFYKDIKRPTEQVSFFSSLDAPLQTGFSYAPSATLYGAEVEFQKYLPLDSFGGDFWASRRLLLLANYTYTQSELQVDDSLVPAPVQSSGGTPVLVPASAIFRKNARLTGQSDHLLNLQIGLEDTDKVSQYTVLLNYSSPRVTNRGPNLLPDFIEKPGIRLDFVAREEVEFLKTNFTIKFEARNLTGTRYQEYQQFSDGARIFLNRYNQGRIISLGVSTQF